MNLRCLVAEDARTMARGIRDDLADHDVDVLDCVASLPALIASVADPAISSQDVVVLLDLGIGGVCRFKTVTTLRSAIPGCPPIVAWSVTMGTADGIWMLSEGAHATADKLDDPAAVATALFRAASGDVTLRPSEAQWFLNRDDSIHFEGGERRLDDAERNRLSEVAEGAAIANPIDRERLDRLLADKGSMFLTPAEKNAVVAAALHSTYDKASAQLGYSGIKPGTFGEHLNNCGRKLFPVSAAALERPSQNDARLATRVREWAVSHHLHCALAGDLHELR